jgi:imidazolonepropionase-like amidohydrolase
MKVVNLIITTICLLLPPAVFAEKTTNENVMSFSHVNIVDVQKGIVLENNFLVIRGQTIEYIGATLPKKYPLEKAINAHYQYLVPGFIDTHAHLSLGQVTFKKTRGKLAINAHSSDEISTWNARELLRWGVTFIRNPGGSSEHNVRYKRQIAAGKLGPGAKVAGEILNQGAFDGLTMDINKKLSLKMAIEQQKSAGVDIIKLYSGLTEQQVQQAIKIGHELDMTVIGHLEEVSWTDAAKWNIDGLVHPIPGSSKLLSADVRERYQVTSRPGAFSHFEWYENVDLDSKPMRELYQALRENKVHVDPTLIVFKNSFYGNNNSVIAHPSLEDVHPELLNNWKTFFTFNMGWQEDDFIRAQKVWPKVLRFVNRLHKEGISLTIGSDLGNPWVIPGLSVHQEMQIFADAGIPNAEILRMATINAAQELGISDEQGSIERGKIANMVFLKSNPLESIANTQTISQVFLAGKVIKRKPINPEISLIKPE